MTVVGSNGKDRVSWGAAQEARGATGSPTAFQKLQKGASIHTKHNRADTNREQNANKTSQSPISLNKVLGAGQLLGGAVIVLVGVGVALPGALLGGLTGATVKLANRTNPKFFEKLLESIAPRRSTIQEAIKGGGFWGGIITFGLGIVCMERGLTKFHK